MRAIKKPDSPVIDGYRIYYNFIRPHMAFCGRTPSEMAKFRPLIGNKWLHLIRESHN